jgi:hypothetical protein
LGRGLGQRPWAEALGRGLGQRPWAEALTRTFGRRDAKNIGQPLGYSRVRRACLRRLAARSFLRSAGERGLRQKVDVTRQSFGRLIVIIDEQAMDVKGGYKKISQFRGIRFPSEIGRNGGSDLAGIGLPADAASPVTPGAIKSISQ